MLAGVIGGVLGGAFAFTLSRVLPAGDADGYQVQNATPVTSPEAKQVVEGFIDKLREMKYEQFVNDVKMSWTFISDPEFELFKKSFMTSRQGYHDKFGRLLGKYDPIRETVLMPTLVRYIYIEHFERGWVMWQFIVNKTQDGWRLNMIIWNHELLHAFSGLD
jgi:hypothetical protein